MTASCSFSLFITSSSSHCLACHGIKFVPAPVGLLKALLTRRSQTILFWHPVPVFSYYLWFCTLLPTSTQNWGFNFFIFQENIFMVFRSSRDVTEISSKNWILQVIYSCKKKMKKFWHMFEIKEKCLVWLTVLSAGHPMYVNSKKKSGFYWERHHQK